MYSNVRVSRQDCGWLGRVLGRCYGTSSRASLYCQVLANVVGSEEKVRGTEKGGQRADVTPTSSEPDFPRKIAYVLVGVPPGPLTTLLTGVRTPPVSGPRCTLSV